MDSSSIENCEIIYNISSLISKKFIITIAFHIKATTTMSNDLVFDGRVKEMVKINGCRAFYNFFCIVTL